jgi:hypothetical protein
MVKRKRRGFTKEFKAQAVRVARESGKAVDTGHGNRTLLIERDIAGKRRPFSRRRIREFRVHRRGEGRCPGAVGVSCRVLVFYVWQARPQGRARGRSNWKTMQQSTPGACRFVPRCCDEWRSRGPHRLQSRAAIRP